MGFGAVKTLPVMIISLHILVLRHTVIAFMMKKVLTVPIYLIIMTLTVNVSVEDKVVLSLHILFKLSYDYFSFVKNFKAFCVESAIMFHHILYFFSTVLMNVITMSGYLSFSVHTVILQFLLE